VKRPINRKSSLWRRTGGTQVMRTVISHPAVTAWRIAHGALRISLKRGARAPQPASGR
jgi:hypothetical protein